MPPFRRPNGDFEYDAANEIQAVRDYRANKPGRNIPRKSSDHMLLASWNIANLGDSNQVRRQEDYMLLAEMVSWFDLIAIQEVKTNLAGLRGIMQYLPESYRAVFTDKAGNNERLAFLYDMSKVERLELAGEVAVPPSDFEDIRLPGVEHEFSGFDRNPFAVAFQCGSFRFTVVNAHSFYGGESKDDIARRSLETYALGRWAHLCGKSKYAYTNDVIVIGDLNMPKAEEGDEIFEALTARGLRIPEHSTFVASVIASQSHYDQLAFFPDRTGDEFIKSGVFDFDGAVFSKLWQNDPAMFKEYVRYHLSDHRILWAQFMA